MLTLFTAKPTLLHASALQAAISDFAAPGSEVLFVSRYPYPDMPTSTPSCTFRYLEVLLCIHCLRI